jgi:hypothetical protein
VELSALERGWAEQIGQALIPRGLLDGEVDRLPLGEGFAEDCRQSPWFAAVGLRAGLLLVWLSPIWLGGRLRTFSGVEDDVRVALLERLLVSRLYLVRMAMLLVKLTACGVAIGHPSAIRRLGAFDQHDRPVPLGLPSGRA